MRRRRKKEEKKKRKTNSKANKKKKGDSNIKKKKHKKKQKQHKKQAEKNPFSVFAEKDGEEVMDDDSVVFIEPSSSDHLPKGTLSRLPLT